MKRTLAIFQFPLSQEFINTGSKHLVSQSYTFPQLNSQNVSSDISYFPSTIHLDIHIHLISANGPQKSA